MLEMLIVFIIVGAVLYVVNMLPLEPTIKKIAIVVGIVLLAIYVIRNLGSLGL